MNAKRTGRLTVVWACCDRHPLLATGDVSGSEVLAKCHTCGRVYRFEWESHASPVPLQSDHLAVSRSSPISGPLAPPTSDPGVKTPKTD